MTVRRLPWHRQLCPIMSAVLLIPARPRDRQPARQPVTCRKRQTSQVVWAAQGSIVRHVPFAVTPLEACFQCLFAGSTFMATQFRLGVICALYFSLHASALAADFQWIAPGDGAWTNAANWNQPFPPGGADVLLFTGVSTAGPVAIDLGVGQTQFINRISVNGLDTSGGAYTFENGTLQIVLGAAMPCCPGMAECTYLPKRPTVQFRWHATPKRAGKR